MVISGAAATSNITLCLEKVTLFLRSSKSSLYLLHTSVVLHMHHANSTQLACGQGAHRKSCSLSSASSTMDTISMLESRTAMCIWSEVARPVRGTPRLVYVTSSCIARCSKRL